MLDGSLVVGSIRRFGLYGPAYEVIAAGGELPGGDQQMHIRVIESGEEVEYGLNDILEDPRED